MAPPPAEPKKEIGFHIKEEAPPYRVGKKAAGEKNEGLKRELTLARDCADLFMTAKSAI